MFYFKKINNSYCIVEPYYLYNSRHVYLWCGIRYCDYNNLSDRIRMEGFVLENYLKGIACESDYHEADVHFSIWDDLNNRSRDEIRKRRDEIVQNELPAWAKKQCNLSNKSESKDDFLAILKNKALFLDMIPNHEYVMFFVHYNRKINQIISSNNIEMHEFYKLSKAYSSKTKQNQTPIKLKRIINQFLNEENTEFTIAMRILQR